MNKNNYIKIYLSVLFIELIFLYFGITNNHFTNWIDHGFDSCDFSYSPSKLLLEGKDPIKIYFDTPTRSYIGNSVPEILCSQYPHYSILTIFFIIPIALLKFETARVLWLIINLCLTLNIFIIFFFKLKKNPHLLFFFFNLFIFSKPYIMTLSLGQWSIVPIYFILIFFYYKNIYAKFVSLIFISLKYTWFPFLIYYCIFNRSYFLLLSIFVLHFISIIFYSLLTNSNFIFNIFAPLKVGSEQGYSTSDLQSFIGYHPPIPYNWFLLIIISFIGYYFYYRNMKKDNFLNIAIITTTTLMTFRHHNYDWIGFLPLLLYIVESKSKLIFFIFISVVYFWYFNIGVINDNFQYTKVSIFALMFLIFINSLILFLLNRNKKVYIINKRSKFFEKIKLI